MVTSPAKEQATNNSSEQSPKINLNVNPTGAGVFGFSNFAETWNGRMAMIGIVAGFANEVITGKGILAQVGITGGISVLFALFFTGFTIATLLGYYAVKATKAVEE
ncbi:MAG: chlorophyll A-B binding protein [Pseudanabaenaceae cyanobacterium bins.39]|nr:chlorophyll A-B binding protein [Pseudanabaenaceae cyanobacterium bins.39]